MKYVITENRLSNLVDKFIRFNYPNFNNEDTEIMKVDYEMEGETYYLYYDAESGGRPFARYWVWENDLQLRDDIFKQLENYFGGEHMSFIIDWFNNEFNTDAESITF